MSEIGRYVAAPANSPLETAICRGRSRTATLMEILLTGEQLSAERALQVGLIHKVVPPAQVMPEAMRFAQILCEAGPPWRCRP